MRPLLFVLVTALLSLINGSDPARNLEPNMSALVVHDRPDGADGACGCVDGTTAPCIVDGKRGTRECFNGRWGPCVLPEPPAAAPAKNGTVRPKYFILMVIYAPPGTDGGRSSSSVTYGSGSTTGSTVSASRSFKQSGSVSVTASAGILGAKTQVGMSFGYGTSTTNNQSLDIKKSGSTEITVVGPGVDGVDHDRDQIWLWLNPVLNLSLTPTSAAWKLEDNPQADIQFVFVGHLKDPSKMPPGLTQRLQSYGITTADFPEILKADPFANGSALIDSRRYQSLNTTFPYEPPFAQGDPATTFRFNASYSSTASTSSSTQNETTVGVSVSGDVGFTSLFKTSVKAEGKWTWTSTETKGSSSGTSESATVTVGGPAFGYTGPTDMAVYYDAIYKTFMFAPIVDRPSFNGTVLDAAGAAVRSREVVIVSNGVTKRTFTNAKGEYRIFGDLSGPIRLQVGKTIRDLPQLPASRTVEIRLP
jgi:hypothetical protein